MLGCQGEDYWADGAVLMGSGPQMPQQHFAELGL